MQVREVFVAGAGLMGSGIAQVAAMAGCRVWLHDVSKEMTLRLLAEACYPS